jgi:hypothetical protein
LVIGVVLVIVLGLDGKTHLRKAALTGRVRRKLFEARITLPLTAELLARIDAALEADEYRVDFVRNALKRELERREKKSGRKHA